MQCILTKSSPLLQPVSSFTLSQQNALSVQGVSDMKAFLLVILLSSGDDVLSLHSSLGDCMEAERLACTTEQHGSDGKESIVESGCYAVE